MADIEIEKKHDLDFETARAQAKKWLEKSKDKYDLKAKYVEGDTQDTISISRKGIDGTAILDADRLRFEAKLGFLAKPLKGKIKQELEKGIDRYFS